MMTTQYPFDYLLAIVIFIVCGVVFLLAGTVLNILSSKLYKAEPDAKNEKEIQISGNNQSALMSAYMDEGKLVLRRANNTAKADVDVIAFKGSSKKKISYSISFLDDFAVIDLPAGTDNVKIIVLTADGRKLNNKKLGYPNLIINIVTSLGFALCLEACVLIQAVYRNYELKDFSPLYGFLFYVLPLLIGLVIGAANFFLTMLITNSFNKGGK